MPRSQELRAGLGRCGQSRKSSAGVIGSALPGTINLRILPESFANGRSASKASFAVAPIEIDSFQVENVAEHMRARVVCLIAILLSIYTGPAWAEKRVALVVGISAYRHVPKLANTANDANDVAKALGRLGFAVDLVLDPDRAVLENAVRSLGRRAEGAEASVFFYAGHALEVNGQNLLVPASAEVQSDRDLRYETVDLELVLDSISGRSTVALLFLDSCRDNPFANKLTGGRSVAVRGLGAVDAAAGTLIAFSTAPGKVAEDGSGKNSPFTTALLNHLERPGIEVRQMLGHVRREVREMTGNRQLPWENSALEGEFYFKPQLASLSIRPAGAPAPAQNPDAFREAFSTALRTAVPDISDQTIQNLSRLYPDEKVHKAQAGSRQARASWRVQGRESAMIAEIAALEGCQIMYNDPCVLVAVNDTLLPPPPDGAWAFRSMSRVTHDGQFDPKQIPVIGANTRARAEIIEYAKADGAKAVAMHPWGGGRIFVALNAADQRAAETDALKRCNDDPERRGRDGSCFLYAVRNRVILSLRMRAPHEPAKTVADALRLAAPGRAAINYQEGVAGKAIAVDPDSGEYYIWQRSTRLSIAENSALALCQIAARRPCVLLATNDQLHAPDPFDTKPRDIEVLRYSGRFDKSKLPFVGFASQEAIDRYDKLTGPKALALKVLPPRLVEGVGATRGEAERVALKTCNDIVGRALPCVLYAVDGDVIFPQNRTAAVD